jgi:hypothetical protein
MQTIGRGRLILHDESRSMAFRFPDTPATQSQLRTLDKMMFEYLRLVTVKRNPEVSVELLGKLFSLGERQAQTVVSEARSTAGTADANLAVDVLHAMLARKIAGVRGTPKTMDYRWLFRLVYEFDSGSYRGVWPDDLYSEWIPLPPDAKVSHYGTTAHITEKDGRQYDVPVCRRRDGTNIIPDWSNPSNVDMFITLHAAFRIDYREWLRNKR